MVVTKPLRKGRPPLARTSKNLSSKTTRTIIRSHHVLEKSFKEALGVSDSEKCKAIQEKISANGGLAAYQSASALGQASERGGDSSRVLTDWLKPVLDQTKGASGSLRLLEVGSLSTSNACSRVPQLAVRRIDLHARQEGIEQMDLMDMPTPPMGERFHILSLSLVLNYVPDAAARGAMLARLPALLEASGVGELSLLPCVFLVLPLACVNNSRYFSEQRLAQMMRALGFRIAKRKASSKLHYSLWSHRAEQVGNAPFYFRKEELRPGGLRNNFCVTLRSWDQDPEADSTVLKRESG